MSRYLNPRSDLVFKKIFGQHKHLLISFLNSLLPLPADRLIESLEYLPTEQIPTIPVLKRTIVDVKCTDQQGRIFICEMQIEWSAYFMQRMLFGASQAYVRQLEKGDRYEYLKPVYGLGLLGESFDNESGDFYHHYKIVNVDKPQREIKGLQFVFIELPKFKPSTHAEKKLQILWLRFMSEIDEKTRTVDPELLSVPEIKEAVELSEQAAYTPEELAVYDTYWDTVSTENTLLYERYQQGMEQGKAEGIEKGRMEGMEEGIIKGKAEGIAEAINKMAVALLNEGMPIEKISHLTGLAEHEIKELINS
jgi:predicted transposase/invertase (TIGR01784 family)